MTPSAALVLLAAGSGTRTGLTTNKVFAMLAGRRVLSWSVAAISDVAGISPVVLVVRPQDMSLAADVLRADSPGRTVRIVAGGATRHASEWNALRSLTEEVRDGRVDVVAIHDTARPLAPPALFSEAISTARQHGGAVPGRVQPGLLERPGLRPYAGTAVAVQTPQAFRAEPLLSAYEAAARAKFEGTDTAACIERFSPLLRVRRFCGPASNLKITFAEDFAIAEAILQERAGSPPVLHSGQLGQQNQILGVADPPTG